jgi:hypothetical protein
VEDCQVGIRVLFVNISFLWNWKAEKTPTKSRVIFKDFSNVNVENSLRKNEMELKRRARTIL